MELYSGIFTCVLATRIKCRTTPWYTTDPPSAHGCSADTNSATVTALPTRRLFLLLPLLVGAPDPATVVVVVVVASVAVHGDGVTARRALTCK